MYRYAFELRSLFDGFDAAALRERIQPMMTRGTGDLAETSVNAPQSLCLQGGRWRRMNYFNDKFANNLANNFVF